MNRTIGFFAIATLIISSSAAAGEARKRYWYPITASQYYTFKDVLRDQAKPSWMKALELKIPKTYALGENAECGFHRLDYELSEEFETTPVDNTYLLAADSM